MKIDNSHISANLMNETGRQTSSSIEDSKQLEITQITKIDALKMVEAFNEIMQHSRTDLKFQYHDQLNEYYVTVVDPITSEIIKEIPPKKLLDMYAAMAEFMGILVDEKI